MHQCSICNRKYQYNRGRGHTRNKCNSCQTNNRRFTLAEKIRKYKGSECIICGYNKCWRALVFHHTNPDTKSFAISGAHARSWNKIKDELDKCILVCSNCHAELHDADSGGATVDTTLL